jgi:SAM-dependent methyltransferase
VIGEQRRLATLWPRIRSNLPPPPATVVELGCGRLGGFVPALLGSGYNALGIDPVAPEGVSYQPVEFERCDLPVELDAIVACVSLHHVGHPDQVLDKIAEVLAPRGTLVVMEWDWESFDEATARWCFERLAEPDGHGWLRHQHDEWSGSGQPWEEYLRGWATQHGLHSAPRLVQELDARFRRVVCERGPYFFPELAETSEADELEAINAGEIRATRIDYVGRLD